MNKRTYYQLLLYPIILLIILSIVLTSLYVYQFNDNFKKSLHTMETNYINNKENKIISDLNVVISKLKLHDSMIEEQVKNKLKKSYSDTNIIINNILLQNKNKTDAQKKALILEYIKYLPKQNKKNKVFIYDIKNKKNLTNNIDKFTLNIIEKNLVNITNNGYENFYLNKENKTAIFIKKQDKYPWLIGSIQSKEKIKQTIKKEFIKKMSIIEGDKNNDLSIYSIDTINDNYYFSKLLFSKNLPHSIGSNVDNKILQKDAQNELLEKFKTEKMVEIDHFAKKFNGIEYLKKHSHFIFYKPFNLVISSGYYFDDLEAEIKQKELTLVKNLKNQIITTVIITTLIIILTIVISYILISKITKYISLRNLEIYNLNRKLSSQVKNQVNQIRIKDTLLSQKSKNEALGEMMAIITHQWRQPLNNINSITGRMYIESMTKDKNQSQINYINEIEEITGYMSQTITDFSNFYNPSMKPERFSIKDTINQVLSIVFTKYNTTNKPEITITESEDISFFGLKSNLQQVMLILINNAIENFEEKDIKDRKIEINISKSKKQITIIFKDNGGGISENIIDNIFEIYTTSKKDKKLRGVGLYMAKIIVSESCKGSISAKNGEKGAIFTILLEE